MSTGFPQDPFLTPNGMVSQSWRKLLQNLWSAASQASPTLLVPTTTSVNGHALTGNVSVTQGDVGLGNLTNDVQTKAAIVPNTAPAAGQVLVGSGTAYVPKALAGDAALTSAGALTVGSIGGKAVNLAGSLTTVGAFASTFTMTGVTAVTFPTSGTLATVNGTTAGQVLATQATSKTTGVTLNAPVGLVTMNGSALASNAVATFTLTNSSIAGNDVVLTQIQAGDATPGTYQVWAEGASAGSVKINLRNISAATLSEAVSFTFAVVKSVTA